MRLRSRTLVMGALVATLALGLAVPALAADEESATPGAWGGICRGAGAVATAVSDLLGMPADEIAAERQGGKSLEQIAAAKDVAKDDLVQTILESRKTVLDQAVAEGRLSQDQADLMLANMQTRIDERVSDPATGPRGGGEAGAGCALGAGPGMGQGRGQAPRAGLGFGAGAASL